MLNVKHIMWINTIKDQISSNFKKIVIDKSSQFYQQKEILF